MTPLRQLEAESVHVLREVAATARRPTLLHSMGKDSSVLLHLAQLAFHPAPPPFSLLFVDTTFKFTEAYSFREALLERTGLESLSHTSAIGRALAVNPVDHSHAHCCAVWKTASLLDALRAHDIDAAIGGARRDEERSRAKERVFSRRDAQGRWDPERQLPELWQLYDAKVRSGETVRVFPLSSWTELDVWLYIREERIPVVPLYFAQERAVVQRSGVWTAIDPIRNPLRAGEEAHTRRCRFRSIGCVPCTGLILSHAETVDQIIDELSKERRSERAGRLIDVDREGSMELKKREGYF